MQGSYPHTENQLLTLRGLDKPKSKSKMLEGTYYTKELRELLVQDLKSRSGIIWYNERFEKESSLEKIFIGRLPDAIIYADGEFSIVAQQLFRRTVSDPYTRFCSFSYKRLYGSNGDNLNDIHTKRLSQLTNTRIYESVYDEYVYLEIV